MRINLKKSIFAALFLPVSLPVFAAQDAASLLSTVADRENSYEARCSAVFSLAAMNDQAAADLVNSSDQSLRSCAIRAAGLNGNALAAEDLLANIENYQAASAAGNKGPYETDMMARLVTIESIWSLGEIGEPRLMARLEGFYRQADDVMKMNLIISIGKLKENSKAVPFLSAVAAETGESEVVRTVALEMLERLGAPVPAGAAARSASVGIAKSDLIYTGGIVGSIGSWGNNDLPVGHAGIFIGTEVKNGKLVSVIADCVPDSFTPGGVRNIDSWSNFTHHFKFPFYGNRTTRPAPTAAQRDMIAARAAAMGKLGLKYSDSHASQKGPKVFDCVGYTEFLYESAGLNPTANSFETGWGWPLTPWEQFIATTPGARPLPVAAAPSGTAPLAAGSGVIARAAAGLANAFGLPGAAAEVNMDIAPAPAE